MMAGTRSDHCTYSYVYTWRIFIDVSVFVNNYKKQIWAVKGN